MKQTLAHGKLPIMGEEEDLARGALKKASMEFFFHSIINNVPSLMRDTSLKESKTKALTMDD